jgi:uncharacterized protein YbjT (DUF2867 family)
MIMSSQAPVLVCGAAGRVGRTGNFVARQLLERGIPVRAWVRKQDERSAQLADAGAEIVLGDMNSMADHRRALLGVRRAYFTGAVVEQLCDQTVMFAIAGLDEGLEAIVNMSQFTVKEDTPSPATRQHWLSEHVFAWSGLPVVTVRPSLFAEQLSMLAGPPIRKFDEVRMPFGDMPVAFISGLDIARVITGVLADPEPHLGKTYRLTGATALTMPQIAGVFSEVLGRPISYVDIPVEQYRQYLMRAGLGEHLAAHLCSLSQKMKSGEFAEVTTTVAELTGTPSRPLGEFIAAERHKFATERPVEAV